MKKLSLILLTGLLPLASYAQLYVEPRISYLKVGGSFSVGDLGTEIKADSGKAAPTYIIGYGLSDIFSLEFRYTDIGELSSYKEATDGRILPSEVSIPTVRHYEVAHKSKLYSLALPIAIYRGELFKFTLTPVASIERTTSRLYEHSADLIRDPNKAPLVDRGERGFKAGAEAALSVKITESTSANVHYYYTPMSDYTAHLFGAGLNFSF
jgi:hypothetical protein